MMTKKKNRRDTALALALAYMRRERDRYKALWEGEQQLRHSDRLAIAAWIEDMPRSVWHIVVRRWEKEPKP